MEGGSRGRFEGLSGPAPHVQLGNLRLGGPGSHVGLRALDRTICVRSCLAARMWDSPDPENSRGHRSQLRRWSHTCLGGLLRGGGWRGAWKSSGHTQSSRLRGSASAGPCEWSADRLTSLPQALEVRASLTRGSARVKIPAQTQLVPPCRDSLEVGGDQEGGRQGRGILRRGPLRPRP